MQSIRIYEMPVCKMVSLGKGMFGEGNFTLFEEWFSSQKRSLFPKDFLYWAEDATDIDQNTDKERMNAEMDKFLSENGVECDTSRLELGNIITSPLAQKIMGYEQMDYYTPIKAKQ